MINWLVVWNIDTWLRCQYREQCMRLGDGWKAKHSWWFVGPISTELRSVLWPGSLVPVAKIALFSVYLIKYELNDSGWFDKQITTGQVCIAILNARCSTLNLLRVRYVAYSLLDGFSNSHRTSNKIIRGLRSILDPRDHCETYSAVRPICDIVAEQILPKKHTAGWNSTL